MKLAKNFHVKYVSFSSSSKVERVGGIKLNSMLNNRLRYKFLDEVDILDDAIYEGKSFKVSEVLMSASKNGMKIFQVIEQGYGNNYNRLYVYYKRNMKTNAQE